MIYMEQGDKESIQQTLDRLIIAKQIENMGFRLQDDFCFYSNGYDPYYSESPVEAIEFFITKTKMGTLKYFDQCKEYDQTISIHFYCLDELFRFKLNQDHKEKLVNIYKQYSPVENYGFDCLLLEGFSRFIGCYLYIGLFACYGYLHELTDSLIRFVKSVEELTEQVKLDLKGE